MNQKGSTIVEFAFTAIIFLMVVFALLDFAVMFWVNLTIQHAVREGARYGITGQGPPGQRRQAIEYRIRDASMGLYDPKHDDKPRIYAIEPNDITSSFSNYTSKQVADTGQPDQIVMVTLDYSWPLLTPVAKLLFKDGKYSFTVRTTMKNEKWQ
jgi:hypothetical protein